MKFTAIPQANRVTREFDMAAGETFIEGAILLRDASEDVAEVAADPTAVLGIAAGPAANRELNPTKMLVHLATPESTFLMAGDDAPTKADIGQDYGVAVDGDGVWHVDGTEITALVVHVLDVDLDRDLYEVTFLASVRQDYA